MNLYTANRGTAILPEDNMAEADLSAAVACQFSCDSFLNKQLSLMLGSFIILSGRVLLLLLLLLLLFIVCTVHIIYSG